LSISVVAIKSVLPFDDERESNVLFLKKK